MKNKYYNLILSGGAFKATAFIGCLRYLEETNKICDIKNIIASSAGSLVGFLFCLGLDTCSISTFMKKGMNKYLEKEYDIDDILDIFDNLGIDDGNIFNELASEILQLHYNQKKITFLEFAKRTGKNFIVLGSNISVGKTEYFSVNTTPNMCVIKALRISISIPFVMSPVIMNNMFYVDASLFNNFPIEYFSNDRPFQDTIALYLECPHKVPDVNNITLFKYVRIIFDAMFLKINEKKPNGKNNIIVKMEFPDDNYGFDLNTMKLVMDDTTMDKYIEFGYDSIKTLLSNK